MSQPAHRTVRALARCLALTALGTAWPGCDAPRRADAEARPIVTVSILPQKFFVERIAGDLVQANVMVGPGESPATYEPSPVQLVALRHSIAYLTIGVPYERAWLPRLRAAHPDLLIVDTIADIERVPLSSGPSHQGHGGDHAPDPHVWLSPALVRIQAAAICDALSALLPAHAETFAANLYAFALDLDRLDVEIRQALAGLRGRAIMTVHPSWGYFARDYGLQMVPVEVGGQEPSAAEMAALIRRAREEGIHIVLAQPEFNTAAAETMARQMDGSVIRVSPLAADWLSNMRYTADAMAEALRKGSPRR